MKNKIIFAKIIFACNKAVKYVKRVVSDTNSETVRKNLYIENTIEPKNYHADSKWLKI